MERLRQLLAEAEAVIVGPDDEPKGDKGAADVVIGTLPDWLKKLGTLMGRKHAQIRAMVKEGIHLCDADEDLEPEKHAPEHKDFHAKVRAAEAELDFVNDLFWGLVKLEFPEAKDKENLLVCAGFELVAREAHRAEFGDLRRALSAMGIDLHVVRAPVGGAPQILVPGSKARN